MSCCTINPKKLCKIPSCTTTLVTGFVATDAGTYTLILMFLAAQYRYSHTFDVDEPLDFNLTDKLLNENQEYIGQIIDSTGTIVELHDGDIVYDGIQFETVISL